MFRERQAQIYPHVADYSMSHLVGMASSSFLVASFFLSPITLSTYNTSGVKWICCSSQALKDLPYFRRSFWDRFFVGVSHHSSMCLRQQRKCRRRTSYEGYRIQKLLYTHGGQHQPHFPLNMDPPVCPISVHPSLQWEMLPLLPRPHVFWVSH